MDFLRRPPPRLPRAIVLDASALEYLDPDWFAGRVRRGQVRRLVYGVVDGLTAETYTKWSQADLVEWLPRAALPTEVSRRLGRAPRLERPSVEVWISTGELGPSSPELVTVLEPLETIAPFRVRAWFAALELTSYSALCVRVFDATRMTPREARAAYLRHADRELRRLGFERREFHALFDYKNVYSLRRAVGDL